jgi:hypothetical protein
MPCATINYGSAPYGVNLARLQNLPLEKHPEH